MPNPQQFHALKAEAEALNRAYHAGAPGVTHGMVRAKAEEAAAAFNAEATRIARRFGRRPKLLTAAALMR